MKSIKVFAAASTIAALMLTLSGRCFAQSAGGGAPAPGPSASSSNAADGGAKPEAIRAKEAQPTNANLINNAKKDGLSRSPVGTQVNGSSKDSSNATSRAPSVSGSNTNNSGNYSGGYERSDYVPVNPPVQTGLNPRRTPRTDAKFPTGVYPRYQSRPGVTSTDVDTQKQLESIADQATSSSGAYFKDADNVVVKAPLLSALITLEKKRSPYELDADSASQITLRDVLQTALESNLPIKIANEEAIMKKWAMVGAFSGFLPNVANEINFQGLGGNYVTPAGLAVPINNGFLTMNSGFNWTLFNGGGNIFTYLQNKHAYRASTAAAKGTVNDVVDEVTQLYYDLVLNEVLLQIRIKQVETTNALVLVNKDQFANGVNTQLDVLQAQYQLSMARQQLIQQQVARREAAVKLATAINLDPEVDLSPRNRLVSKIQLVDPRLQPRDLIKIAIDNRQELKRWDELRIAAKDQLKVAKSTLSPVIAGSGSVLGSGARATSLSNDLGGVGLSTAGAGVGPAGVSTLPLNQGTDTGPKKFTTRSLFIIGVDVQWQLGGLGLKEISQIEGARADARKATLEFNRALSRVYQEVRDSYLSSLSAENLIVETTDTVNYGAEQLRVAEIRLKDGVGTSLDVVNAQKDYINALVSKANAIVQYDVSQAKLLHAIGRISMDTVTSNVPLRQ